MTGDREKRCAECGLRDSPTFSTETKEDYAEVLEHYLEEHWDSARLQDAVGSSYVETVCQDCERAFFTPVSIDPEGLHIEIYCPDCEGKEFIRRLMVKPLTARDFVEYEADPTEDNLGEKTGRYDTGGEQS